MQAAERQGSAIKMWVCYQPPQKALREIREPWDDQQRQWIIYELAANKTIYSFPMSERVCVCIRVFMWGMILQL